MNQLDQSGYKIHGSENIFLSEPSCFCFYTLLHWPPLVEKHFVVSNRFMALLNCRLNIEAAAGLVWQSDYSS